MTSGFPSCYRCDDDDAMQSCEQRRRDFLFTADLDDLLPKLDGAELAMAFAAALSLSDSRFRDRRIADRIQDEMFGRISPEALRMMRQGRRKARIDTVNMVLGRRFNDDN